MEVSNLPLGRNWIGSLQLTPPEDLSNQFGKVQNLGILDSQPIVI